MSCEMLRGALGIDARQGARLGIQRVRLGGDVHHAHPFAFFQRCLPLHSVDDYEVELRSDDDEVETPGGMLLPINFVVIRCGTKLPSSSCE